MTTPAGEAAKRAAEPTTDVLYIGGAGRSGSTVLALLLGQLPGFVPVGGLNNIWERGLRDDHLCGCGARFRECRFWRDVGHDAFGGWDMVDTAEVARLRSAVARYRAWPWHLATNVRPGFARSLAAYADYVGRLYGAVRRVSGSHVIVDNSHDISPALLLRRVPGVRGHILHLVRDSRGVAYSLSRRVVRAEATSAPTLMPRYGALQASLEWVAANVPYHVVPQSYLPRLRVRYESLVRSPDHELGRIAEFLGADPDLGAIVGSSGSVPLIPNHMVSGNPHRLGRTQLELRLDNEWQTAMKAKDRMTVTLITAPLRLAYARPGARSNANGTHAGAA